MHEAVVGEILTRLQSGELNLQQADIRLMEESQNSQAAALGHVLASDDLSRICIDVGSWREKPGLSHGLGGFVEAPGRRWKICNACGLPTPDSLTFACPACLQPGAWHRKYLSWIPQQEARCPSDRLPIDIASSPSDDFIMQV